METNIQKSKRPSLRFNENEIKLALKAMDKLEKPLNLMYYLMEREDEQPFVLIFISAKNIELEKFLDREKRDTDLLFEIDDTRNLFAVVCQETKVDGAYRFAERLLRNLIEENADTVYCIELEVRSTKHDVKDVIFKSVERYITSIKENKEGEIVFRSLH